MLDLHHQLRNVAVTAVGVNADSMLFPEDWLFRWRWSKGKKQPAGPKKKNKGKSDKASEGEGGGEEGGEDVKPKDRAFLALVRAHLVTTWPGHGGRGIVFSEC